MLTIQFPDLKRLVDDAQRRLDDERDEILQQLGVTLLRFAQQDYTTKSGGGTGTDGITWKKLAPSTLAARGGRTEIGLQSGLQRASLGLGRSDPGGVTVGYGRSYSPFFDDVRPLLPDRLPQPWLEALEQRVMEWGTKIVDGAFQQCANASVRSTLLRILTRSSR